MTRLRSNTRDLTPLYVALAIGAATYLIGCHLARAAGAAAATPPPPGIDWGFWTGILLSLATAGSYVLHALAARRHSATLETIANDIDAVRLMAKGAPETPLKLVKPPAAMLAVLLLGALAAPSLTGCTASQARQTASAGAVAALDCESIHLDAQLAIDLRLTADAYVKRWITGTGAASTDAIAADLAPIKSDAVKCAIVGALAAATTLIAPPAPVAGTAVSALSVPGPDPAVVRDRFRLAARTLGWAPVKIAGGDVL